MPTDKKQTGFRFNNEDMDILEALKVDTGLTATGVVVMALRDLAKRRGVKNRRPSPPPQATGERETGRGGS